jgi:hypothetical protein
MELVEVAYVHQDERTSSIADYEAMRTAGSSDT